jgi:hypothetical protein
MDLPMARDAVKSAEAIGNEEQTILALESPADSD